MNGIEINQSIVDALATENIYNQKNVLILRVKDPQYILREMPDVTAGYVVRVGKEAVFFNTVVDAVKYAIQERG